MPIAIRARTGADQTPAAGPLGIDGRAGGVGRFRDALSEPRRGSPADRRRNCIRRRRRRFRRDMGASRSAGADAWWSARPTTASRPSLAPLRREALAGQRFHVEAAARMACRRGRIFSIACALRISRRPGSQAKRRSGISAPRRRSIARSRSPGPAIPRARAGASIPRAAACGPTATMLDNRPDFFIHCGDHIYADCPIEAELKLPDGKSWRNIVTEEKSVVAHSLAQFRGNYKYNLLDENFRAFNAQVPMLAQWDDHEVTNDWSPFGTADDTGYAEDGTSRLVARGRPRVSRIHADPQHAGAGRPDLPQGQLWAAARRLSDRHAQLPRFDIRTGAATATTPASSDRCNWPG